MFIRFALAKAAVTYGLELMIALFNIVQGLISTIMNAAGFGAAQETVLPAEIVTAVEDCGFFESIPLWAVTLIGGLFITVLSFIMIMTVYGRFFKLYLYTAIAPVPLSAFAGEPSQNIGKSFIKSYAAVCLEADATTLVPNDSGHIIVNGLEDDTYTLTEIATDKGYVLLKDGVEIVIAAAESENACETCGAKLLTASGTVNGEPANMESGNAIVPLMVINNPGFDLPKTGGYGTWMFTVGGCMLLGVAAFIVIRGRKHNKNDQ